MRIRHFTQIIASPQRIEYILGQFYTGYVKNIIWPNLSTQWLPFFILLNLPNITLVRIFPPSTQNLPNILCHGLIYCGACKRSLTKRMCEYTSCPYTTYPTPYYFGHDHAEWSKCHRSSLKRWNIGSSKTVNKNVLCKFSCQRFGICCCNYQRRWNDHNKIMWYN